mmetsp:Transcript_9081/g.10141  ORF Transcript_9081/g.10141 Transcript_9081/m.10141 type:complete len:377 (-) Transcript_9081:232-1362(-)
MKFVLVVQVVGLVLVSAAPDDFRFLNEMNACNDPAIQPVTGICEPECYCIPDTEPCDGVCPPLDNRVLAASPDGFQEAAFFQTLEVDNPNTLFTYDPPGCQPYPLVAQTLQIPVCEGLIQEETGKSSKSKSSKKSNDHYDDGPVQCSFDYKGKICRTKRYNLVQGNKNKYTKNNKKSKSRSRTFVTHEGECGVCSTAQDLAVNLSPTLGRDAFQCSAGFSAALAQDPTLIAQAWGAINDCFRQLGFTSNCATIWASNGVHTTLVTGAVARALQQGLPPPPGIPQSCVLCASTCLVDPTLPECLNPMKAGSCDLSNCFSCDEDTSGPLFKKYSGRTRRNSGIITTFQNLEVPGFPFVGSKRPCSTIASVKQPSTTCN